jgi:beta-lactamase regulating signal transducer with metallopeptidase domain
MHPRLATWLLTLVALTLASASTIALGLLAANALIRVPAVANLGSWSLAVVQPNSSATVVTAWVAGVALVCCLVAAWRFAVGRAAALRAAYAEAARLQGVGPVVTDDHAADAYALPGRPGRIVVSAGMLAALDEPGRAALLAHERAHVAGRHYLFTSAAQLAAAMNPLLRPVAGSVEYSVERWADEQAATTVGDRRQVAATVARAAVAAKASGPHRRASFALGAVSLSGAGPVPRRVAALLAGEPHLRLRLVAACLVVLAITVSCTLEAGNDLQDLLSLALYQGR